MYNYRYVTAQEKLRRKKAMAQALHKSGYEPNPIIIEGRTIARTFWGKAWCNNLESYSDYENRLPRGRTYVRNDSIIDLQLEEGGITALVAGSELYKVNISIQALATEDWERICLQCRGQIHSIVELLKGNLSTNVMTIIAQKETGLFPSLEEISIECECLDWARLCKHSAAVLYGIGARLDTNPELLFTLRGVKLEEIVTQAMDEMERMTQRVGANRSNILKDTEVQAIFGDIIDVNYEPS